MKKLMFALSNSTKEKTILKVLLKKENLTAEKKLI